MVTIEVYKPLYERARDKLELLGVTCLLGDSASCLRDAITACSPDQPITFWLDGHYSGQGTGAGAGECPIIGEFQAIAGLITSGRPVVVAVDDIRCFGSDPSYPPLSLLVDFADTHQLHYTFAYDVFIASSKAA